jgi:hypothetical protein
LLRYRSLFDELLVANDQPGVTARHRRGGLADTAQMDEGSR